MPINLAVAASIESVEPCEAWLTIDVEVRDYLVGIARRLNVPGIASLNRLDPWDDSELRGDDLEQLAAGLPMLRRRLTTALELQDLTPDMVPPDRVGFLDLAEGLPFGREGAMRLLVEMEDLANRALRAGECIVALGD